ncbi:MAG: hypothetical protein GY835_13145 [bacterium]|nr:hypothetical protein [bacterium]
MKLRFTTGLVLMVLMLSSTTVLADADPFVPTFLPELNIRPCAGKIRIDGQLDDPGWRGAERATNFTETTPGDCVEPPHQTEVLITYDDDYLYLAFIAADDPNTIRAGLRDRDEIWRDDYLGIILDTYNDQSWSYELFANPLGIQGDLRLMDGGDEDMGFNLIWRSEGMITEEGYQVEFAIPFSSLRFPATDEQIWRATFWRNRPRTFREKSSWAAQRSDDPCFLCQFGTLRGIRGVQSGNQLEILPAVIGFQSSSLADSYDPDSDFKTENPEAEFGFGLKYSLGPNLSLEATYNPDFSQIESDAAQVSVNNPYALYQPERRPFFQRGSNLFNTWINAVHTRSIMDPLIAAKMAARHGNTSLLYLAALDDLSLFIVPLKESSAQIIGDRSYSNIFRARHTMGNGTFIGGLLTDRRLEDGGSNTVGGLDFARRFNNSYRFELQSLASHTEEPDDPGLLTVTDPEKMILGNSDYTATFDGEKFWGHAIYASLERDGRHWSFDIDYNESTATFRADNGFLNTNNRRSVNCWTNYVFRRNGTILNRISPRAVIGRIWDLDGNRMDEWLRAMVVFDLARQTRVELHRMWSSEVFDKKLFNGIQRTFINANTVLNNRLSCGTYLSYARMIYRSDDPFLGKQVDVDAWAQIRLGQRLRIDPSLTWVRMDHPDDDSLVFDTQIIRTRLKYQFSRRLFLRLVLEYQRYKEDDFNSSTFNLEPLLSYKVNPFTVFYLGSTHSNFKTDYFDGDLDKTIDIDWRERDRQYFIKFQYLFQT